MEDIKVGEYVRSLVNGNISKVLEISDLLEEPNVKYYKTGTFTGFCSTENYNVKHSPNITDLIEVGDYVNGFYVINKPFNQRIHTEFDDFFEEDIKSIVTKEMFSSVEYRVENN